MINKSGYIAILGRPNVGKSTFLNRLLPEKISITSKKPQTTRHQVMGIKTLDHAQLLFVDTPGLHQKEHQGMSRYMNRAAKSTLRDVDIVIWMVDASRYEADDDYVLEILKTVEKPIILLINKVDLLPNKTALLPFIDKMQQQLSPSCIMPISAEKDTDFDEVESHLIKLLPVGDFYFDKDTVTDRPNRFRIAEIVREKVVRNTGQELPYSTTIEVEDWRHQKKCEEISVIIWVEKPGQKAIVIGKSGDKLKRIGTDARKDIEVLLKKKVFLRLWVKVKENWSKDDKLLRELGYNE